jgi:hypothetical protein
VEKEFYNFEFYVVVQLVQPDDEESNARGRLFLIEAANQSRAISIFKLTK